jgi:hypothetical protein
MFASEIVMEGAYLLLAIKWLKSLHSSLQQTHESLLDELENKYIKGAGTGACSAVAASSHGGGHGSDTTIHLEQVTGLWYIFCMGIGLAFVMTLSNYLLHRYAKPQAPSQGGNHSQEGSSGSGSGSGLQRPALNKYKSVVKRFVGFGAESEPGSPRSSVRHSLLRMFSNSTADPVEVLHESAPNLQLNLSKVRKEGNGTDEAADGTAILSFHPEEGEDEKQGKAGGGVRAPADVQSPAATARGVHPHFGTSASPTQDD